MKEVVQSQIIWLYQQNSVNITCKISFAEIEELNLEKKIIKKYVTIYFLSMKTQMCILQF